MQVRVAEVNDPVAGCVLDPRVADVPLPRDGPVEDLCARRHLVDIERDLATDEAEGLADPVARDAAADRIQLSDQLVHRPPDPLGVGKLPVVFHSGVQSDQTFQGGSPLSHMELSCVNSR